MLSSNFTPSTHTVTEHSVITVYCNATGYPEPTFSWTIDGQAISDIVETISKSNSSGPWVVASTVSFNASRLLAGELNCTATNGISPNGIHSTNLAVQCEGVVLSINLFSQIYISALLLEGWNRAISMFVYFTCTHFPSSPFSLVFHPHSSLLLRQLFHIYWSWPHKNWAY